MRQTAALLVALLFVFAACSSGTASGPNAIHGIVTDHSGTPLPGVSVTIERAGSTHTTVTDAKGQYGFENLAPGEYAAVIQLEGFKTERRTIRVVDTKAVAVRTKLALANVSESITVTAASPMELKAARKDRAAAATGVEGGVEGGVVGGVVGGVIAVNTAVPIAPPPAPSVVPQALDAASTAQYQAFADHTFIDTRSERTTTFAIDVDHAAYSNVRRFLTAGLVPPPDAVRVEEMLNYFTYSYPQPTGPDPFSITTEVASCPWNADHRLLRIGIQGRNLEEWRMAPNNLVFLIDVSGSMQPPARLPLIKTAFRMLVDKLRAEDRVAIVVYAGAAGLVLPSTSGADKSAIVASLDNLQAGGSTAGAAGIQLAYDVAKQNFIAGGNNRVILATDGDFNVGMTSHDDLLKLIEQKREDGIYLTTIGVGDDNYNDAMMELLADHGNGNYSYLDNLKEAEKVFVRELTGTLVTIAKDVKVQLEFNPELVTAYRQIGYENRALENKDFDDDRKDAGELGAGHSVTALYEIAPASAAHGRIATLRLRYKQPAGTTSQLITADAKDDGRNIHEASSDLQFAAAVAEFAMLLRNSKDKGTASFADASALVRASRGADLDGTRGELLTLLESAKTIQGGSTSATLQR